jgi:hypothetical protein
LDFGPQITLDPGYARTRSPARGLDGDVVHYGSPAKHCLFDLLGKNRPSGPQVVADRLDFARHSSKEVEVCLY